MKAKEKSIILKALETAYYQCYVSKESKYHDIVACQSRFYALELERLCRKLGLNKEVDDITKEFCYKEK